MTSYNYSYNVLINRLEAFAAGHFLIKRFTHGQIDMSDQLQDDQYPFMHVTPDTITPVQGGMQFGFHIMFADIPRDKEYKAEYQREVISDCIRLGQDLVAEVQNGLVLFGFDVQLINDVVFEPFMEEQKNTVTGVAFTIKLEVPWDWSACDIPAIWSVGGASGSGGSGTGYGIQLQVNGTDNIVQTLLNLQAGSNITITDEGNGTVTIDSTGGGGGGGEFVSTEYNVNHVTATGNPYLVGDRVWYNGSVYRCIANNDAINPTNPTYWTLVAVGYRLRQSPVDWDATTGDYQILNKPTIPAAQIQSDWNQANNAALDFIKNKPTIPSAQGLQDVITEDNVLTANNTIDVNQTTLTFDDANDFIVNATDTINHNVNGVTKVEISPTRARLVQESNGRNVVNVTDTEVNLSSSNAGFTRNTGLSLTPTTFNVKTIDVTGGSAVAGQVLTLVDPITGDSRFVTPAEGTVNSVALSMPAPANPAFSVSGSPITNSGTLAVAANGTIAEYVRGDGSLATTPTALPPNGAASGDLQGSYPNPTVHRIHNYDMQSGLPADGDTWVVVPTPFGTQPVEWRHQKLNVTQLGDTTTIGQNLATLPNPSAIRYLRINADNTATAISAATLKTELGGKQLAFKTADQSSNVLAFADVTDLSFAVVAGRTYKFKIFCQFDVTNAATGTRWAVNGPAFTRLFYNVIVSSTNASGTQANVAYQTYDGPAVTTGSNFTTNNCAIIEGIVVPSANGTIITRFACELTITSVTCKTGSYIEFEEI